MPTDISQTTRAATAQSLGERVIRRLFDKLLSSEQIQISRKGSAGEEADFKQFHLRLPNLYWTIRILLKPDLMLGQTYVDGRWSVQPDKLFAFLYLIRSQEDSRLQHWFLLSNRIHLLRDAFKQRFFPIKSTRAVVEHYNTDPVFMSQILGRSLSYTCAFFGDRNISLDDAQQMKLDLIAERISLRRGQTVLDLGTGWGYAPFPLAEAMGCRVTGITISRAQVEFCNDRRRRSLARDLLEFLCVDYEAFVPVSKFDRVISVGMLEHVGKYRYKSFFNKVGDFLREDGVALIHSMVDECETSPDAWIDKHIFPGGYIPTVPEVVASIDDSVCELVALFTHDKMNYFTTLDRWKGNLFEHRAQCEERLRCIGLSHTDATKVIRVWEYFLSSSQIAFSAKYGRCKVAQFVVRRRPEATSTIPRLQSQ